MDDRGGLLFLCLFLMTLIVIGEGQNSHAHECPTYQSDIECYTVHAETITECARACRPCDAYGPDDFCDEFKRRKRQAYDDSDDDEKEDDDDEKEDDDDEKEDDDDDDDDDRSRNRCEDLVKRNRTVYSCGCCDGWTYDVNGECKIRLNDTSTTVPVTCRNGGTSMGTYCLCPEDFSGRYCEVAHCDPKCKHSGVCVGRDGQPTCVCSSNHTGVSCETPVCDPPCSNGGTCQSDHYQTYCLCPEGYTGKYCETHAPPPGVCPPPDVGICIHDCSGDSDCKNDEKCCFNGCGHVCMKGEEKPAICVHNNITYQMGDDMKRDPCTKCTCLGQGQTHSSDGFVCAVMDCFQNCPYGTFPPGPDECCPKCKDNSTEGVCPPPTGMGTCIHECSEDSECEKGEKCCSNGCGHSCKKVKEKPSICVHNNITYQIGDYMKKDPCTMCTCLGQGQTHSSDGFVCAVMDCFQNCPYGTLPPGPDECCPKCKGVCPPPTGMGTCEEACSDDLDCENSEKCCSNGCGHVCMEVTEKPTICVHNNITYQIGDNMKKDPCTMCTCLGQGQTHSSDGFVCAVMDCFQDCRYGTVPPGPDECCPKCKVKPPEFKVCPVSLQVTVHRERNEVHAGDLFSRSVVAVDGQGMELYVHFSQVMFRHCACDNMNMNIYRVVASATDIHGYDVHCYFTVTVIDVHPPVYLTCPANVQGYNAQYVWWETPGVTDNVAIKNHKLITGMRNGDYFKVGSHLVVYEAEDFEGNKADCRFLVEIYGNHDKSMPESLRRNEEEEEKRRMFIGVGIGVAVLVISLIALTVLCYLRIRTKKQLSNPPSYVGRNGFDNNAYAQYGKALPPSYEKSGVLDKPPVYEELFPNQQDTAIYTDPDEVKLSVDKLKLEFKA